MKRPQLYLETSVWNFYFADDAPEKKVITHRFLIKSNVVNMKYLYQMLLSKKLVEPIIRKRQLLLNIIKEYHPKRLMINEEVVELAKSISQREFYPPARSKTQFMQQLQRFLRWMPLSVGI